MHPRAKITHGWRRGLVNQPPRREHERLVRRHAVSICRWAIHQGFLVQEAAQIMGISSRTLRNWRKRWQCPTDRLEARHCGRPAVRCPQEVRKQILGLLKQTGPNVGVPALRSLFGSVSRAELTRLLCRYRRVCRVRYPDDGRRLTWHRAGTVWALDFVVPPGRVEGRFECVLAVRDLASGFQLMWQAMTGQTAEVVVYALRALFVSHSAPLVLKSDNGSAFIAELTAELLSQWQVIPLFSPPLRPQYNGACERANGTLRTYTDYEALREGHPGDWASRDLAQALARINHLDRPRGLPAPARTPAEAWQQRTALTCEERRAFGKSVAANRRLERARRHVPAAETLDRNDQAAVDRVAVRNALLAHGLLTISSPGGPWPAPPRVASSASTVEDQTELAGDRAPFVLAPPTLASPGVPSSPRYEQEFTLASSHGALPAGKIDVPARPPASSAEDVRVPRPAHVGQGLIPVLWRLITLPIDLLKTAKIP